MKGPAAASLLIVLMLVALMLAGLTACSKSDDVRENVAAPQAASVASRGDQTANGAPSEVPNSASPDDVQLGGGIRH